MAINQDGDDEDSEEEEESGVGSAEEEEEEEEEDSFNEEELEQARKLRQKLEDVLSGRSKSGSSSTESDMAWWSARWVCGGVTSALLVSLYLWNDAVALDVVTMVLSLASLVYVWTNG